MELIALWFLIVGLPFYFSGRTRLRRLPVFVYSMIRAFTLSQLISPTILGFWSGFVPAPAALVVYYGLWLKFSGNEDRLISRNLEGALYIWGIIFALCFFSIWVFTAWRERREQAKKTEAFSMPMTK